MKSHLVGLGLAQQSCGTRGVIRKWLILGAIVLALWAPGLRAATFNVANGDIAALKTAINTANANAQDDVINLAANGTYLLEAVDSGSGPDGPTGLPPFLRDGDLPDPSHSVTINGNGATVVRSNAVGIPAFRLLLVKNQTIGSSLVTIFNITFTNGRLSEAGVHSGGGIYIVGDVVLNSCTISNNTAPTAGGIYNQDGRLTMNNCTVSGNTASNDYGGALWTGTTSIWIPRATLTNCTFSGNSARISGGAIYNQGVPGGSSFSGHSNVFVTNCTVSGGGIHNDAFNNHFSKVHLANTILSGCPLTIYTNPGNVDARIVSEGYNLSTGSGDGFLIGAADQTNTDPKLDPAGLLFNGGPTQTIALTSGSPAIDRGHGSGVGDDQRGFVRPVDLPAYPNASGGEASDIGAFESGPDPMQSGSPSFVVTTTDDHDDGVCGVADCTLREALRRANAVPGANVITFAPGLTGTITLLPAQGGELIITDSTTIAGPGASVLAISSNTQSRLFYLPAGVISISGLTLRDGFIADGAPGTTNSGGGIFNAGTLTLTDCTLSNNRVSGANAAVGSGGHGGAGQGGAIFNMGSLNVEGCTFSRPSSGNGAFGGSGADDPDIPGVLGRGGNGGAGLGSAIFNDTGRDLTITNCTFSGNSAGGGAGGNGFTGGGGGMGGGAVFNEGTMTVTSSTFSGNFGSGGAGGQGQLNFNDGPRGKGVGGIRSGGGTSTLRSTLVAGNTRSGAGGPDVDGTFTSGGYNLVGTADGTTGFDANTDQRGTNAALLNPMLGTLQNNGGQTHTMLLLPGSPAIDKGRSFGLATDQRGLPRPLDALDLSNATGGDASDIGAVEIPTTHVLPLAPPRSWPASIPGPLGTLNAWGVRTWLNQGLNGAEDLTATLDFLAAASGRTPALSPNTVIDTREPNLNFVDPSTNGAGGVVACPRPFPADALSTSTNGGAARDDDHVVTSAHGSIQITEESDYTFNFRGDDGFMFRIKAGSGPHPKFLAVGGPGSVDQAAQNILYYPIGTGDANTRGIIHLTPGVYKLEYATWEGIGGFFYQVSAAKGFFPNNEDTTTWAAVGYQTTRVTPIAYPSMIGDWTVLSTAPSAGNMTSNSVADAAVDAAVAADATLATSLWPEINFHDPEDGGSSSIPGDSPWPGNTPSDDDHYAMHMSGTLHIPEDGNYLIGYQGDDGSRLTVGGVHAGFSTLTENLTGFGIIGGRVSTIAVNSGSVGASGNFSDFTSAVFGRPGAITGSPDTGISTTAADPKKMRVPYNAALNPAGDFSAEIWLKPSVILLGVTCAFSSGNFGNPRSGWLVYMDPAAGWNFRGYINAGVDTAFDIVGGGVPVAGQWYHVVVTWVSATGTATIYVNGSEAASVTGVVGYVPTSDPAAVHGRLHIGSRSDNAFGWDGDADELAIYGSALNEATVLSHYANGTDGNRAIPYQTLVQASAPLGYWRLNDQPRTDLGTITTDVPTGNSRTVGRIFLTTGDYPISALFWEAFGGSSFEIFASREILGACVALRSLKNGGWPGVLDNNGLALVPHPAPVPAVPASGLTILPNTALSVTFTSVPFATYTLQCSTDLVNWLDLNNNIEATAAATTYTGVPGVSFFVAPGDKRSFYRIMANP